VYVNNILIYTDRSLKQYQEHVQKVLRQLQDVGLQLDINKCEFEVKSTKYLRFIVEAEKGIQMDPRKVVAILE
jgi:hypothetical protein